MAESGESRIIKSKMTKQEVAALCDATFGDMLKIVVDINEQLLAAGGGLHADSEALLIKEGALKENIWGANYYPNRSDGQRIEYSAFINIRPSDHNASQEIESPKIREIILKITERLIGPS